MRYSQYRFKFYLNASHAIYIQGIMGERHPHTWEIQINAIKQQEQFVKFDEVETIIEAFLEKYQNKFLNSYQPFDVINPTLENISEFLMKSLQGIMQPRGWAVYELEVSETPTRSYIISLVENSITTELQRKNLVKDIIDSSFSTPVETPDNNNRLQHNHNDSKDK